MTRLEFYDSLIKRLERLYGKDIPNEIMIRYSKEKNFLKISDNQDEFIAFCELLMNMNLSGKRYSLVGPVTHSFILYLMTASDMNPLPANYYCARCRKIQFVTGKKIGIDLPNIKCSCGCKFRGNGFDLEAELFWEKEPLDLMCSVSEEDYEFVKIWLCENLKIVPEDMVEEFYDSESVVKRLVVGPISLLCERTGVIKERIISWNKVQENKELILQNYDYLLPVKKKLKRTPQSIYELIRLLAFLNTLYIKSTNYAFREEDILTPEEKIVLLEKYYEGDINRVPVFIEDGLPMGEWSFQDYEFTIMFTKAFSEYVLDEINDKMLKILKVKNDA